MPRTQNLKHSFFLIFCITFLSQKVIAVNNKTSQKWLATNQSSMKKVLAQKNQPASFLSEIEAIPGLVQDNLLGSDDAQTVTTEAAADKEEKKAEKAIKKEEKKDAAPKKAEKPKKKGSAEKAIEGIKKLEKGVGGKGGGEKKHLEKEWAKKNPPAPKEADPKKEKAKEMKGLEAANEAAKKHKDADKLKDAEKKGLKAQDKTKPKKSEKSLDQDNKDLMTKADAIQKQDEANAIKNKGKLAKAVGDAKKKAASEAAKIKAKALKEAKLRAAADERLKALKAKKAAADAAKKAAMQADSLANAGHKLEARRIGKEVLSHDKHKLLKEEKEGGRTIAEWIKEITEHAKASVTAIDKDKFATTNNEKLITTDLNKDPLQAIALINEEESRQLSRTKDYEVSYKKANTEYFKKYIQNLVDAVVYENQVENKLMKEEKMKADIEATDKAAIKKHDEMECLKFPACRAQMAARKKMEAAIMAKHAEVLDEKEEALHTHLARLGMALETTAVNQHDSVGLASAKKQVVEQEKLMKLYKKRIDHDKKVYKEDSKGKKKLAEIISGHAEDSGVQNALAGLSDQIEFNRSLLADIAGGHKKKNAKKNQAEEQSRAQIDTHRHHGKSRLLVEHKAEAKSRAQIDTHRQHGKSRLLVEKSNELVQKSENIMKQMGMLN